MHRGYFALWRRYQDHPFWKEKREFSKAEAWLDILWEVQHKEEPQEVVLGMTCLVCEYGESLKSLETWSKRWGWNKSRVRRFLQLLKNMNQIRHTSEKKTTRITVLNYSQYDPKRNDSETQVKRKRNASETTATPDKNVNNKRTTTTDGYSENFQAFWEEYPKKIGKAKAFTHWKKHKCDNGIFELIMKSLDEHKNSAGWIKDNGQFIPQGDTWVSGRRWEDTPNASQVDDIWGP